MQTQAPSPPPATDPGAKCPNCGKAVDSAQPFCLDCGRRIARRYRKPPDWRIPLAIVALLVVAAGVAAGFGITQLTNKDEGPDTITVSADRPAGAAQPAPGAAAPAAPTPAPAQPAPDQPPTPEPGRPTEWPAGEDGYTVVLLTTKSRETADATARKAADAGLTAGVLESDDFKRFEPGLYVVFAGRYDSIEAASAEARKASTSGNPGAYARFVEPKTK